MSSNDSNASGASTPAPVPAQTPATTAATPTPASTAATVSPSASINATSPAAAASMSTTPTTATMAAPPVPASTPSAAAPAVATTATVPSVAATPSLPTTTPAAAAPAMTPATAPTPVAAPLTATSSPQQRTASTDAPSQEPALKPTAVVVPQCSTWFSLDAVNPLEKRMLPEFFVTSDNKSYKTPALYVKYRNFMVNAYRQQPHVYLTATACRRNLAGDACAILRVHEFLTHWGLINYSVPPHAMPPAASANANYALRPATVENTQPITVLPTAGMRTTHSVSVSTSQLQRCATCSVNAVTFELSADGKRKAVDLAAIGVGTNNSTAGSSTNTSAANTNTSTNNSTSVGSGTNKELVLGAFGIAPGTGLCDDCYLNRAAYPEGIDATDFVHVAPQQPWTQVETTALLDAVAASGTDSNDSCDWNVVATKVRTKTASECMLRFLELPILEHAAIGTSTDTNNTSIGTTTGTSSLLKDAVLQQPFTYAQAMNAPVLDMAALLSTVDPFVAKAAARAAINAVKTLHTMAAGTSSTSTDTNTSVKTEEIGTNNSTNKALEQAAAAVARSAVVAGIADRVKTEDSTSTVDGDVEMKSVDTESTATDSVLVTKEVVAVVHEASSATAAALLAVRANAIADATAKEPVRDLVRELVANQVAQLELKMQQLDVLEKAVAAEKDKLAQETYALYVERLAFAQQKLGGSGGGATGSAGAATGANAQ